MKLDKLEAKLFASLLKQTKFKFLAVLMILVVIAVVSYLLVSVGKEKSRTLEQYAQEVLAKCANDDYRPSCYDEEIPKLMDFISMEEAFDVTRIVQSKDSSYQYCHVLGHKLSARETAKDPSKWIEVVTRAPSGTCSNGAIHGAFQERFRTESMSPSKIEKIKPELAIVCEKRGSWNPTSLEQATCYHALGHLTMYITNANIDSSVELCSQLAKSDERDFSQVCYDGVFMQIFQPLEPEDFALIEGKVPKKEELETFCSAYPSPKKESCWSESWPMFREELKQPQGLASFCSNPIVRNQIDRCYSSLIYVLTAQFNFDPQKIESYCQGLIQDRVDDCFANAASRIIETDKNNVQKSIAICNRADSLNVVEACYQELVHFSTYNFHAGSPEFYNLCNALPNDWRSRCIDRGKNFRAK